MAWTWSAPERGTIAAAAAITSSQNALHKTALMLGRGDAQRGLCIGFAAFLTIAGAAAPNLSSLTLTSLLFAAGTILVLYATVLPSTASALLSVPHTGDAAALDAQAAGCAATRPLCLQELLAQDTPLSSADRAAFARLTAHMSHELRTPLNAILGFSEMMSNEVFGPLGSSCYAGYARDIHASGLSLLKSAEDALAITALLTAPDHHHKQSVAHAAVASHEAIAFHAQDFAARGISAACTVDTGADIVACPHAARQLMINLVSDAASRAEPGAHLSIASRTEHDTVEILVTVSGTLLKAPATDSFSMILARTLGELSGARLIADQGNTTDATETMGAWQVAARFARAAQNDFFATAH